MIDFDKKPFESLAFIAMSVVVLGLVIYGINDYIYRNMTPLERAADSEALTFEAIKKDYEGKYVVEQHGDLKVLGVASDDKGSDKKYIKVEDDLYNDVLATVTQISKKGSIVDASALEKRLEEKSKADSDIVKWLKDHPGIAILIGLVALLFLLSFIFSN